MEDNGRGYRRIPLDSQQVSMNRFVFVDLGLIGLLGTVPSPAFSQPNEGGIIAQEVGTSYEVVTRKKR